MKTFGLFLLLLLLPGAPAAAQSEPQAEQGVPQAHGVSVVKANWRKYYYNPALDEDPLRAANDARQLEKDRKETQRSNAVRQQLGLERKALPTQTADGLAGSAPNENRDFYVYEVKVVNNGRNKIKSLSWEYVLLDPATEQEVGRHSFDTKADIGPRKTRTLVGWSAEPPAGVVDVRKPDKDPRASFAERVDIRRVVYDDGTTWERPREK